MVVALLDMSCASISLDDACKVLTFLPVILALVPARELGVLRIMERKERGWKF